MDNYTYWKDREETNRNSNLLKDKKYDDEIKRIYRNMHSDIQTQVNAFWAKYSESEGITISGARKRVAKMDVEAFSAKAAKYVANKDFSDKANEELKLYNLKMKINRLRLLKSNIRLELISGHNEMEKTIKKALIERSMEEFKRQAGILGNSIKNNTEIAHAIVNASFKNATFSSRIWMQQDALRSEIDRLLQIGLIQGKNPRELARELRKIFNVSNFNALRLMRTELRRVQTEASRQSFDKNGYKKFMFIAENDSKTCTVCNALDGQVFEVSDMEIALNAPPLHPQCRCSIAAYMDREEIDELLKKESENDKIKEPDEIDKLLDGLKDMPFKTDSDRVAFAKRLIDNAGIDRTNISVAIELINAYGRTYFNLKDFDNGLSSFEKYALMFGDPRDVMYQMHTVFHEFYHLSAEGKSCDYMKAIKNGKEDNWLTIEESFAEASANYLMKRMGYSKRFHPTYEEYLVRTLPRLKQMDDFKDCVTIDDFGEVAIKKRLSSDNSVWLNFYDEVYSQKLDDDLYYIDYMKYVILNKDKLINIILEAQPYTKKSWAIHHYDEAISKMAMGLSIKYLSKNEFSVVSSMLIAAMDEMGVK